MDVRYSRQLLFQKIGSAGQESINGKHVVIVGAGALGSASAEMLTRAGVGRLSIIDRDYVEWSNLQRQQLYTEVDAQDSLPKAIAAKAHLDAINSDITIEAYVQDADAASLIPFFEQADVMIDATDNFDIRFILNDLAQKYNVPWIYGSCVGSYGTTLTILPGETPCLNCLLNKMPMGGATCDTVGIISPAVQMVAGYQVGETLKLLVGDTEALRKTYLSFDVWTNQHQSFKVAKMKTPDCPSCGESPTYPHLFYEGQTKTERLCGRDTVQIRPAERRESPLEELEGQLKMHGEVTRNPYLLSVNLGNERLVIFKDGRTFVHGTDNIQRAKKIYYSLLG